MIYYLLFSICESISNQRLPKIYNLRLIYKNLDILTSNWSSAQQIGTTARWHSNKTPLLITNGENISVH